MAEQLKVLGISGSLRKASFNTMALKAAQKLVPDGMSIEIADISQIPLYNEDLKTGGNPESVEIFRRQIKAADGVLFVSPEYNYTIPGVLKNAYDWASRAPDQPFNEKPVAVMGASTGMIGTARMQYDLRKTLVFTNAFVMPRPEVMIGGAASKFGAQGNLIDEKTQQVLGDFLKAFQGWILRVRQ
jgi:chromate reductase, NAD(P)H dehydrogenase (quinone)